jgi:CMP-N-acetylneuraminic acid synthetase
MVTKNHALYLMNKFNSLDINDIEDIKVAKKLL